MRSYHSFSNWSLLSIEGEDLSKAITFGIEIEVTADFDRESESPESLAEWIEDTYEGIFICERDGSIGEGVEIISMPMTMKWYTSNLSVFKNLLKHCEECGFVGEKGNLCGLHVHYGRKGLGFSDEMLSIYPQEKRNLIAKKRQQEVEMNIGNIMETFQEQVSRISGRINYGWCNFNSEEDNSVKRKKEINESYYKQSNMGSHGSRYHVVNYTNTKTVEIRIMRSTINFSTFDARIRFLYNVILVAKEFVGIANFKTLINYGDDEESKEIIKRYIMENRNINPDDVKNMVSINMKNEYRLDNLKVEWR